MPQEATESILRAAQPETVYMYPKRSERRTGPHHSHERNHTMSTDTDIIITLARKLEAQNPSTLEAENATLRRERDQLKADAMSDLINRHQLENQVRNREAENAALRAENAALRAGQGRWPDGDDSPAGEQVPREISAEELTLGAGQWIAYTNYNRPQEWMVERYDKEEFSPHYDGTIVLLEDAPTSDDDGGADQDDKPIYVGPQPPYSHAILPDGRIINYDQAKHIKDGDPETKPAPRLTVHALNTAPVGSDVSTPNKTWTKNHDGTWFRVTQFGQHTRTSEELLAAGYANATLTYPEQATP